MGPTGVRESNVIQHEGVRESQAMLALSNGSHGGGGAGIEMMSDESDFTDWDVRNRHDDDEDTTTLISDALPYGSDDDDDEDGEEDVEDMAHPAGGLFWRGLEGASSVYASRRQPKCPRCQENQQASDCNYGVCGQCCRELRRDERGQVREFGQGSQTCRRHPTV